MKLSTHIVQGVCLSPAVYYAADLKTAIIFTMSFVFIDVDHYIHFVLKRRNISIKEMFIYYDALWDRKDDIFGISIFHTVEFLFLLFLLGLWHSVFRIIGAGFLTHLLFDIFNLLKHRVLFARAFSCIEYLIRRKRYPKELLF